MLPTSERAPYFRLAPTRRSEYPHQLLSRFNYCGLCCSYAPVLCPSAPSRYFSKVIKYQTGEYVPAPRPKKKTTRPQGPDGKHIRGTHYTPADIPDGEASTAPSLEPWVPDGPVGVNKQGHTPGMVFERALYEGPEAQGQKLPPLSAFVESSTYVAADAGLSHTVHCVRLPTE